MQTVCGRFPKACKRREVTVWKFEDFKIQECSNRWIPLKKAVMLYLTVRKPTCFKCYRPFFRTLQNCTIHVNISDKLDNRPDYQHISIFIWFFFFPWKGQLLPTLAPVRNTTKMLFLLFKSQHPHHADWALQELQTARSQTQYLRTTQP